MLEDILLGIIDAFLLRKTMQFCSGVDSFFSKLARSVLRHIRVASKKELKDRIIETIDHFNRDPVVHTWSYRLDQAA